MRSLPSVLRSSNRLLEYSDFYSAAKKDGTGNRVFNLRVQSTAPFAVSVFPCPATVGRDVVRLAYTGQSQNHSHCRLYSLSGSLVRELSSERLAENYAVQKSGSRIGSAEDQRVFLWNMKNEAKKAVGAGVYLYVIEDGISGVLARGKIAVVGQ